MFQVIFFVCRDIDVHALLIYDNELSPEHFSYVHFSHDTSYSSPDCFIQLLCLFYADCELSSELGRCVST